LTERHFPLPWIVEELEACFYVCDSAGQKLASRRSPAGERQQNC